jgi:hypothetical protein
MIQPVPKSKKEQKNIEAGKPSNIITTIHHWVPTMVRPNSQVQQIRPPKKCTWARARANGVEGADWRIRRRMIIHGCWQWYKPNICKNFKGNEYITGLAIADRLLFPRDSTRKCKSPTRENRTRRLFQR